ncbi:energy transducer TonB [Pseudoalteromonas tunicata]|uniref:energy transducer TonB n=1 Tax=Pseudoalteromonas tunicata TaxID=314281 RepID=UPI00273F93C5|nr:energy transducer TonB [Pseudoalteromonas tunicata]MDP4985116.1 energy transducer TonB [Pseudoalteromonas tunicata]MDP5215033.1 energy transducer TonB [Pseudoalteromonas tunicata]
MKQKLALLLALSLTTSDTFAESIDLSAQFNTVYQQFQQAQSEQNTELTIELANQAFTLGKDLYGEQSINTANLAINYALALPYEQRDFYNNQSRALKYQLYIYAKNVYEKHYSPKDVNQIEVFIGLAKTTTSANESAHYFEEAIELSETQPKLQADLHYQAATHLFNHFSDKKYRIAKKHASTADKMHRELLPENTIERVKSNFLLASIAKGNNKKSEAIERLNEIVTVFDSNLEFDHPYELAAHSRLVELYESTGKSDEATKHCIAIAEMVPWKDNLDPSPLYRQEPRYPKTKIQQGKDGWVQMQFDISATGFVKNIVVLDSEGGSQFEEESIKALEKWRYAPKFENGRAVVAGPLTVQLDFKIRKS